MIRGSIPILLSSAPLSPRLFWFPATDDQFISKFISTLSAGLLWWIHGNLRSVKYFQPNLLKKRAKLISAIAGAAHDAVSGGVPGGVDVARGDLHAPWWDSQRKRIHLIWERKMIYYDNFTLRKQHSALRAWFAFTLWANTGCLLWLVPPKSSNFKSINLTAILGDTRTV